MASSTSAHYSFGDVGPAEERLRRLAELYNPRSAGLLRRAREWLGEPISLAIDLGSGPGYTTALVADTTGRATNHRTRAFATLLRTRPVWSRHRHPVHPDRPGW